MAGEMSDIAGGEAGQHVGLRRQGVPWLRGMSRAGFDRRQDRLGQALGDPDRFFVRVVQSSVDSWCHRHCDD